MERWGNITLIGEAKPLTAARSTKKLPKTSEKQMERSLKHLEISKDRNNKDKLYFFDFLKKMREVP